MNGYPVTAPGINLAVVRKAETWEFLILTRAGSDAYAERIGLLGGTREGNESVAELAARELIEETGLTASRLWLSEYVTSFFDLRAQALTHYPVLVAEVAAESVVQLDYENSAFAWLPAEQARGRVSWRNLADLIHWLDRDLQSYPPGNWVQLG